MPAMRKVSKIAFAYASLVAHLHLTHTHIHTHLQSERDREKEIVRVAPDAGEWRGESESVGGEG